MPEYDENNAGLLGFGVQYKNIASDVQGLSGFSVVLATNVQIEVRTQPGLPANGVTITLAYIGNDGLSRVIIYDPLIKIYPRKLPLSVPITISVEGNSFLPQSTSFTLSEGGFESVVFTLEFREAYARITKKRFL